MRTGSERSLRRLRKVNERDCDENSREAEVRLRKFESHPVRETSCRAGRYPKRIGNRSFGASARVSSDRISAQALFGKSCSPFSPRFAKLQNKNFPDRPI